MSAGSPPDELVHLAVDAGVATITLDSPANRNALSLRLQRELAARVAAALADEAVRLLLLTHTGTVFCAGADLKEARSLPDGAPTGAHEFLTLLEALWTSPKPIIARLAGPARAGGLGLLAVCDLAVVVETATFGFSEVTLGVVPAVISVPIRRRVHPAALQKLFLTGEAFSAHQAVECGLVASAVAADALDQEVARLVQMLVRGAPGALAATKALLRIECPSILDELVAMSELSATHFASDEGKEGIRAFAEKRPPSWVPSTTR